jgi:hypothetical protein
MKRNIRGAAPASPSRHGRYCDVMARRVLAITSSGVV